MHCFANLHKFRTSGVAMYSAIMWRVGLQTDFRGSVPQLYRTSYSARSAFLETAIGLCFLAFFSLAKFAVKRSAMIPTFSQMCCHTTLRNINVRKLESPVYARMKNEIVRDLITCDAATVVTGQWLRVRDIIDFDSKINEYQAQAHVGLIQFKHDDR